MWSEKYPLLFFQNISGFMVGKEYEHGGIAKDGAKMVMAVSCVNVPKYMIIIGGSQVLETMACGRAYSPRMLWTWPNARISVMGGEQAALVLSQVKRDKLEKNTNWSVEDEESFKKEIREQYENQGHPYYATGRLWDDGILDPLETRRVLGLVLSLQAIEHATDSNYGVFGCKILIITPFKLDLSSLKYPYFSGLLSAYRSQKII